MINLILAIICSSGNSLIMKFHEKHSENRVALLLMNYVMAVIFGGALVVKEIARLDFHRMGMTPLLGMVNGFFYVSAFLLLQLSIRKNGATVSASLSHMGLLIPVLLSIVLFSGVSGKHSVGRRDSGGGFPVGGFHPNRRIFYRQGKPGDRRIVRRGHFLPVAADSHVGVQRDGGYHV